MITPKTPSTSRDQASAAEVANAPIAMPSAPAAAHASVTIAAPVERIWRLIADPRSWPRWYPAVKAVRFSGDVVPGNVFVWTSKGLMVTSTLRAVEPMQRLTWTGVALGTQAVHDWEFSAADSGVLVRTWETFDGWLPRLLPRMMQRTLDTTLPVWLHALKVAAEADSERAGPATAGRSHTG